MLHRLDLDRVTRPTAAATLWNWIAARERGAFLLCVGIGLLPVWLVPIFPSADGPVHLYIAHLVDALRQPDPGTYGKLFELNRYLEPNSFIYGFLWLATRVFSAETAEKLFITVYWLGFAAAARACVTARDARHGVFALLLLPFGFGFFIHMGFYNFCFSMVLFLAVTAHVLRHVGQLRRRDLLVIGAGALLTGITHLFGLLMLCLVIATARIGSALATVRSGSTPPRLAFLRLCADGARIAVAMVPALLLVGSFYLRHVASDSSSVVELTLAERFIHIATIAPLFALDRRELLVLLPFVGLLWVLLARCAAILWRDDGAARWRHFPVLLPTIALLVLLLCGSLVMARFSALPRLAPFFFFMVVVLIAQFAVGARWRATIVVATMLAMIGTAALRFGFYREANALLAAYEDRAAHPAAGSTLVAFHRTSQRMTVNGRSVGWRLDITVNYDEFYARRRNLVLLNSDLLSPSDYGYFPVQYRAAPGAWVHAGALYPNQHQPAMLARFEAIMRMPIHQVEIWPRASAVAGTTTWSAVHMDDDLATELARGFARMPGGNALAPDVYRRTPGVSLGAAPEAALPR